MFANALPTQLDPEMVWKYKKVRQGTNAARAEAEG
jgi:hypothetical protein